MIALHLRAALAVLLLSLLLIAPCLLAPRIQAGDLSSHIYNAWLARLIDQNEAPGLYLAPMSSNWLFDVMLLNAWKLGGPEFAQRFCVSASVLIFFWGSFALTGVLAGKRPWTVTPILAMLSYGWIFHSGFFNYYLSMGFCFWIMALLWIPSWKAALAALPLALLAFSAHILPVAIVLGLLAYLWLARALPPRRLPFLLLAAIVALAAAAWLASRLLTVQWTGRQWILISGANQFLIFGPKYVAVFLFALFLWAGLLARYLRSRGWPGAARDPSLHLLVLCAAAVLILPSGILPPGMHHPLLFIPERISLWVAVLLTGIHAGVPWSRGERWLPAILAAVLFSFIGIDWRALNRLEDHLERAVASLPPGQRVVNTVSGANAAFNPIVHLIDRVCIRRCFSFANYEASTANFRVRALGPNPIVIDNYADSFALQSGGYVVKPDDFPLYGLFQNIDGTFFARPFQLGEQIFVTTIACPPPYF